MNSYSSLIEEKLKGDTPRQKYESLCEIIKALEMIYGGNTMAGIPEYTYMDVIQKHYQIAREALTKATPTEKSN